MLEIRIHGRGGQGAVIASKVLARAFFMEGFFVQSFPAFGVERRGAPVCAFTRVDRNEIYLRCQIYEPGHLIVLDPTLIEAVDLVAGLKEGGWIIINSEQDPESFPFLSRFNIATVDANSIALSHHLGSQAAPIVNTAILGAFSRATGFVGLNSVVQAIREMVPSRPWANVAAAQEAYEKVRAVDRRPGIPDIKERVTPVIQVSKEKPPSLAVSFDSMRWNKTGSWRNVTPLYEDKTPPCNLSCPAGEKVQSFLALAGKEKYAEALSIIREDNPLPGVCGRVCYHPCEDACNRGKYDDPLAIHALERFLADNAEGYTPLLGASIKAREGREKVAIVGSGPAGLSAAYHLALLGYRVTVFEALPEPGGMLRVGIPAYRLPREVLDREIGLIQALGVEIRPNTSLGRDISWDDLKAFNAVFLATGAHKERRLGIPGEQALGVVSGLEFLRDVNQGREVAVRGRVAVIGGGNTAIDAARTALRLGAHPVLIYRRSRSEMPAISSEVSAAKKEGVEVLYLAAPVRIITVNGRAKGIECQRMRLGEADLSGRRTPEPIPGSTFNLEVDGVIVAIGEEPDLSYLPEGVATENGCILTNESGVTSIPGLFAGGDAATKKGTVVDAIGSGKKAARAIDAYLRSETIETKESILAIGPESLNWDYFERMARAALPELPLEERVMGFREANLSLSKKEALLELRRCLSCGVCNLCDNCWKFCPDLCIVKGGEEYRIDYDYCKGCGICFNECPRGAMSLQVLR